MPDFSCLISAITDVGYWRWWSENLPDSFQLEFSRVQLYEAPNDPSERPSNLLALRFIRPSRVSFLRQGTSQEGLPMNWPLLLQADKLDPLRVSYETFAVNNDALFQDIISQAESEEVYFKDASGGNDLKLAFWASNAGIRIEAAKMQLITTRGEVDLFAFADLHHAWWDYWKEYWKKHDTDNPLPKDLACEVTIPIA